MVGSIKLLVRFTMRDTVFKLFYKFGGIGIFPAWLKDSNIPSIARK
jgi:hypothetical protein